MTIERGDRETPVDYLSRLSFRNGRDSLRRICSDFRIALPPLLRGRNREVEAVARLGSSDVGTLHAEAFRVVSDQRRTIHRGQELHASMTSYHRVRICPACVTEDIERGGGRIESRPWRRSHWILADIATCTVHSLALVDLQPPSGSDVFDFSRTVTHALPGLVVLSKAPLARAPSCMETYILDRLSGRLPKTTGETWLHALPLYATIRLCEVVGAVVLEGIDAPDRKDRDDATRERQAAGLAVAIKGPSGLRALLADLQQSYDGRRSKRGPRAAFGRFYKWLEYEPRDPAYDPIRRVIRDHCLETMAVGPGELTAPFGWPVETRRLHSIRSASLEYGINPVSLRKILFARGIAHESQRSRSDDWVTFDATANGSFLKDLASAMTADATARHLGLDAGLLQLLVSRGLLVPWLGGNVEESAKYHFRREDVDRFVDTLLAGAQTSMASERTLFSIAKAAKRACCSQAAIVELLLDGKLVNVAKQDGVSGYHSILVDPSEVLEWSPVETSDGPRMRKRPATSAGDGITMDEAHAISGIPRHVLLALTRLGAINCRQAQNEMNRHLQTYIARDELDRFLKEYAPLSELATRAGVSPKLVKNRLTGAGIGPAVDPRAALAVFYRRSDLPDLGSLDLVPQTRGRSTMRQP